MRGLTSQLNYRDRSLKISIIIPTLNEAKCLGETLTYIQQLSPHEVIVSDGGSDDGTLKIDQNLP